MYYSIRVVNRAAFTRLMTEMEAIGAGALMPEDLLDVCEAEVNAGVLDEFNDKFPGAITNRFREARDLVQSRGLGWELELFHWAIVVLACPSYQRTYIHGTQKSPTVVFLGDYDAGMLHALNRGTRFTWLQDMLESSPLTLIDGPMAILSNDHVEALERDLEETLASADVEGVLWTSEAKKLLSLLRTYGSGHGEYFLAVFEIND